jgi:DNA-binding response OmpR family regulator
MRKVLIVEDDLDLASIYQKQFEMDGYEAILAGNGQEGVEKANSEKPDLILLDILMPIMNGMEALVKLKADPKTKEIPVIIMTVLGDKDKIDKALALGAVDYLIKSDVVPSEIVDKAKKVLRGYKILIIEDNTELAKIYEIKLSGEGFDPQIAVNGEEGMKAAKEVKPDLILLDLVLPEADGFKVLETVKKDPKTKNIPVFVFSNSSLPSDINRVKILGAAGYIIKSELTLDDIVERIRKILKKQSELNKIRLEIKSKPVIKDELEEEKSKPEDD